MIEIMDKFDLAKIKNFYSCKRQYLEKQKTKPQTWRKYFAKDTSDK